MLSSLALAGLRAARLGFVNRKAYVAWGGSGLPEAGCLCRLMVALVCQICLA